MNKPFKLLEPLDSTRLPLIFDSPHSGAKFPSEFQTDVKDEQLKTGWDAYVDELWENSVALGAHILAAEMSRMYIDLNRAPNDIDPTLLSEDWDYCNPTKYSERGMGLIRRFALPNIPIYTSLLTPQEIEQRLELYYYPYHNALQHKMNELHAEFSGVWHIDCHSMKSTGNAMNIDSGKPRPDIILGNNDGKSAESGFTDAIENAFTKLGYKVVKNDPYKGGYLVTNYGAVANNCHSLQIEINRALYMNEASFSRSDNFDSFQSDLTKVAKDIADYVKTRI